MVVFFPKIYIIFYRVLTATDVKISQIMGADTSTTTTVAGTSRLLIPRTHMQYRGTMKIFGDCWLKEGTGGRWTTTTTKQCQRISAKK